MLLNQPANKTPKWALWILVIIFLCALVDDCSGLLQLKELFVANSDRSTFYKAGRISGKFILLLVHAMFFTLFGLALISRYNEPKLKQ